MAMLKLCRCGNPITLDKQSCDICITTTNRKESYSSYDKYKRDKQSTAFYKSKAWKVLSNEVYIEQHGLCQICLENKKMVTGSFDKNGNFKRNIIDHIIPIKIDWSKRLCKDNLWVLCISCHSKKTAEDKKKYGDS